MEHEITKEAVALMRRAASITGNEEIRFAASHIQSEYDKKHHQNTIAKEPTPKAPEEPPKKVTALRANMEERKKLFSMRASRQNQPQNQDGLMRPIHNRQSSQQQLPRIHQRFTRRNRRIDAQGNQLMHENADNENSSSGTLSDVSSNGIGENPNAGISMVHYQFAERNGRPQVHPLQRTKSASTSDIPKRGKNQRQQNPQFDETSFAKLTLEEAHTLQSIADKTGNKQLKAISSRVQKIVNENSPSQTPDAANKETKEASKPEEKSEEKQEKREEEGSIGYLSIIDLIPTEVSQSSICEFCDTCEKSGSKAEEINSSESEKIATKLPPPTAEFVSGAGTC